MRLSRSLPGFASRVLLSCTWLIAACTMEFEAPNASGREQALQGSMDAGLDGGDASELAVDDSEDLGAVDEPIYSEDGTVGVLGEPDFGTDSVDKGEGLGGAEVAEPVSRSRTRLHSKSTPAAPSGVLPPIELPPGFRFEITTCSTSPTP